MNSTLIPHIALLGSCLFVLAACGDDDRAGDAGPSDAGSVDSARPDSAGGLDAGHDAGSDPCATDEETAGAAVGCNGAFGGPAADNAFGGACDVGAEDRGTCTDLTAYCDDADDDARGQCLVPCTPTSPTYVSTGGCPTGSRCFDFGDGDAWCYPDCTAHTDCPSGLCGYDGTCLDPDACVADEAGAASTLGCNGAPPGAQSANALGGTCTPDGSGGQGSCTE